MFVHCINVGISHSSFTMLHNTNRESNRSFPATPGFNISLIIPLGSAASSASLFSASPNLSLKTWSFLLHPHWWGCKTELVPGFEHFSHFSLKVETGFQMTVTPCHLEKIGTPVTSPWYSKDIMLPLKFGLTWDRSSMFENMAWAHFQRFQLPNSR